MRLHWTCASYFSKKCLILVTHCFFMCVLFMRMEMAILWGAMVTNGKNRLSPWKKTRERHAKTGLCTLPFLMQTAYKLKKKISVYAIMYFKKNDIFIVHVYSLSKKASTNVFKFLVHSVMIFFPELKILPYYQVMLQELYSCWHAFMQ